MICPKCNEVIKDGYVLCDKCGYDIQMVPDFDAVIEVQIDETLSAMLKGLNLEDLTEEEVEKLSQTLDLEATRNLKRRIELAKTRDLNSTNKNSNTHKKKSKIPLISTILAVVALIIIIGIGYHMYLAAKSSPEGLAQQAVEAEERNDFSLAAELYKQSLEKNPDFNEAALGLAYNLMMSGNNDEAIDVLMNLINTKGVEKAYDQLILLYEELSDYNSIANLIKECTNDAIRKKYSKYIVSEPQFNMDEGIYEDSVIVKLMSEVPGHIYYTIDGTEPTDKSIEYISPFEINEGKVVVRAVLINQLGIQSDSVSRIYEIEKTIPDKPVVKPESGDYKNASYIECELIDDFNIYYTTDGTMPNENSRHYDGPILMKEGDMSFKFIAVNQIGKRSDISTANYSLQISARCFEDEAINYVTTALMASGKLADLTGLARDGSGIYNYTCEGVIYADNDNYYIVSEVLTNNNGDADDKIEYYAVNSVDGSLMRASKNSDGYYELHDF